MTCACLSVCLSVCPPARLRNYTSNLHQMHVTYGRGSVSGGVVICYILPVLWMTSFLHAMPIAEYAMRKGVDSKRLNGGQHDSTPRLILI